MGYYQGDYGFDDMRRRGVLRGDPGFFSFLGQAAKSLVGFVPGVGPIASKVISGVTSIVKRPGSVAHAVEAGRGALIKAGGAIVKHPALTAAGAAGALGLAGGAGAALEHHLLTGGRKHKRMNVYNPRALRRALRRAQGFAHMARKIIRVTSHFKHPKKFHIGHFKKKSRKK